MLLRSLIQLSSSGSAVTHHQDLQCRAFFSLFQIQHDVDVGVGAPVRTRIRHHLGIELQRFAGRLLRQLPSVGSRGMGTMQCP